MTEEETLSAPQPPRRRRSRPAEEQVQQASVSPQAAPVQPVRPIPSTRPERTPLRYQPRQPVSAVQPVQQDPQPVKRPVSAAASHPRVAPPPAMDRPGELRRHPIAAVPASASVPLSDEHPHRVPLWMLITLAAAFVLALSLLAARYTMSAYLVRRQQEREAAYQAVLNNHPISWQGYIEAYAEENNLDPAFVSAIIMNESSYRPTAESNIGARGLMQLMPDTAEWIARKLNVKSFNFDMMYDPETNIRFGCWYLGYLSRLFQGDPASVSAAYHAGQGQVTTWLSSKTLSKDGVTLDLNAMEDGPTKSYAKKVIQAHGIYRALYFTPAEEAAPADGAASAAASL